MGLRVKAINPIEVSALQKSNSCLRGKAVDPTNMKRTAKNKLLPRSQRNRLQIRRSQKSKSTCLKVTEIDLTNEGTQKGKKQNQKESLKIEGQKAILYNQNRNHFIALQPLWL